MFEKSLSSNKWACYKQSFFKCIVSLDCIIRFILILLTKTNKKEKKIFKAGAKFNPAVWEIPGVLSQAAKSVYQKLETKPWRIMFLARTWAILANGDINMRRGQGVIWWLIFLQLHADRVAGWHVVSFSIEGPATHHFL